MNSFDALWVDSKNTICKYIPNLFFESGYVSLMGMSYESLWRYLQQCFRKNFEFDLFFEQKFLELFSTSDLDVMWNIVSVTKSYETYTNCPIFEDIYRDIEFNLIFSYYSMRIPASRYCEVQILEHHFNELIPETDRIQKTVNVSKPSGPHPSSRKKVGTSLKLKTLLEKRLKRLKLMNENIMSLRVEGRNYIQYKCVHCGFESRRKRKLFVSHILKLHLRPYRMAKKSSKRQSKNYVSVLSGVRKTFDCSHLDCSKSFTLRFARKRHILVVHQKLMRFRCSLCLKGFRDIFNLRRHKKFKHKLRVKIKCSRCAYSTDRKNNFLRHCERMHEGESLSTLQGCKKCSTCGKVFSLAQTLNKHMLIHEAISIGYDCPVCGRRKDENHKCLFTCKKCASTFLSKPQLLEHARLHARIIKVKESISSLCDMNLVHNELFNYRS